MIKIAIVGGTGYTGVELIRLLAGHEQVQLVQLTSRSEAGTRVDQFFPSLRGVTDICYSNLELEKLAECDVVFFATPHGVAMQHTPYLLAHNTKVIDLAADFRLQSLADFTQWYGIEHSCPDVLKQAVYGLPELNRVQIKKAQVIGNPGCYPTTALLGLQPLLKHGLVASPIIIDAKSGISGAGRQAKTNLLMAEAADNFQAYGVAGHRHLPEIQQGVAHMLTSADTAAQPLQVRFLPHLVPMIRGMFSSIHVQLNQAGQQTDLQRLYEACYAQEFFVDVLPKGTYPDTRSVRASNRLRIAVHQQDNLATILVVQDNLVKGAAGQAVQNMNIMCNLPETMALTHVPVVP